MASKTIVQLVDDLDGGEADESIAFSLDGVTYEIDLSSGNADAMREAISEWIGHARRIGGRRTAAPVKAVAPAPKGRNKAGFTIEDRHAIQRFAKEQGLRPPADRGRIARELVMAWEEAGSPA